MDSVVVVLVLLVVEFFFFCRVFFFFFVEKFCFIFSMTFWLCSEGGVLTYDIFYPITVWYVQREEL